MQSPIFAYLFQVSLDADDAVPLDPLLPSIIAPLDLCFLFRCDILCMVSPMDDLSSPALVYCFY